MMTQPQLRKQWVTSDVIPSMFGTRPLVVLSGGQDSTTVLALARKRTTGAEIHTISFDYGQRHSVELACADTIATLFDVREAHKHRVSVPFLQNNVTTELLQSATGDVGAEHAYLKDRPASFVPARNALFLTMAYGLALEIQATSIVTGVCQTDYSGYPDCRNEFIGQLNRALDIGYESSINILTPVMFLDKAETFKMAEECNALPVVIEQSHTCYNGDHETKHDWGYGCGECPACKIRAAGYDEFVKRYPTP